MSTLALPVLLSLIGVATTPSGLATDQPWWLHFEDPTLEALVAEGLGQNLDLRTARARIDQAVAISRQSLSSLLPSVTFEVGASTSPYEAPVIPASPVAPGAIEEESEEDPAVIHNGSAMVNVRLNADLWGQRALDYRASRDDLLATREDVNAQALALANRIAAAYFDAITAAERIAVIEQQLESNRTFLALVEQRYEHGGASAVDILQQRQQIEATRAQLPINRIQLQTARQRLAVLIGRTPAADLPDLGCELRELPVVDLKGLPTASIDRPDLRAATARVDAAEDRRKSSVRGLLPRLSLNGQAGLKATYLEELEGEESWGVGAAITVPLFEGGRNYASIRQAEASATIAVGSLEQLELQVAQEVASARVQEEQLRLRLETVARQRQAAFLAHEEGRSRYAAGLDSYLSVLTSLGSLQQTALGLVQARRDRIDARIRLFEALGGSWTVDVTAAAVTTAFFMRGDRS